MNKATLSEIKHANERVCVRRSCLSFRAPQLACAVVMAATTLACALVMAAAATTNAELISLILLVCKSQWVSMVATSEWRVGGQHHSKERRDVARGTWRRLHVIRGCSATAVLCCAAGREMRGVLGGQNQVAFVPLNITHSSPSEQQNFVLERADR